MKLTLNNTDTHDYELPVKFEVDYSQLHSSSEKPSFEMVIAILNGKIELKNHDRAMTSNNFYIEYKIQKKGINDKFTPSGLSTTQADYWGFNIGESITFIDTNFLRWCLVNINKLRLKTVPSDTHDTNIGYGMIIPINRYTDLQKQYRVDSVLNK